MTSLLLRRVPLALLKQPLEKSLIKVPRATITEQERSLIGSREIVGYGFNGQPVYVDLPDFPFPAIRWKEISPEICALREKEKGDWNELTCEEKKALYRVAPTSLVSKKKQIKIILCDILQHPQATTDTNKYTCDTCWDTFGSLQLLQDHSRLHYSPAQRDIDTGELIIKEESPDPDFSEAEKEEADAEQPVGNLNIKSASQPNPLSAPYLVLCNNQLYLPIVVVPPVKATDNTGKVSDISTSVGPGISSNLSTGITEPTTPLGSSLTSTPAGTALDTSTTSSLNTASNLPSARPIEVSVSSLPRQRPLYPKTGKEMLPDVNKKLPHQETSSPEGKEKNSRENLIQLPLTSEQRCFLSLPTSSSAPPYGGQPLIIQNTPFVQQPINFGVSAAPAAMLISTAPTIFTTSPAPLLTTIIQPPEPTISEPIPDTVYFKADIHGNLIPDNEKRSPLKPTKGLSLSERLKDVEEAILKDRRNKELLEGNSVKQPKKTEKRNVRRRRRAKKRGKKAPKKLLKRQMKTRKAESLPVMYNASSIKGEGKTVAEKLNAVDQVNLNVPSSSSTNYTILNTRELEESPSLDTFLPKSPSKLDASVKTSGKIQKRSVLMTPSSEGKTVAETLKVSSSSSAIGQVDSNVSSSSSTTLSTKVLKESPCLNKVLPKSSSKSGASVKTSGKIQKHAATKASREDVISKRLLVVTEQLKGSSNSSPSAIDQVDLNVPSSSSTNYAILNTRGLEESPNLDTFLPKSSSKLDASVKTSGKRQKRSVLMRSSSEGETVAETLKVSSNSSAIGQVDSNVCTKCTTLSTKVLEESPCLNKVLPKSSSKLGASVKTSGKIQKRAVTKASRESIISKLLLVVTEELKGSSNPSASAIDQVDLNVPSSSSTDHTISNPRELEESPSLDTFLPKSSSKLDASVKTSGKRQKCSVLMRSSSEGEPVAETLKVSSSSSAIGPVDSNVCTKSTTLSTKVLEESPCLNKVLPKSSSKSGASVKTSGKIQKRAVTKASRESIISKLLLVVTEELKGSSNPSASAIDQVDLNVPSSSSTDYTISNPRELEESPSSDTFLPKSSSKLDASVKTSGKRQKRSVLMMSSSEGETVAETLKVSSSSSAIGPVDSNVCTKSTTLSTKVLEESPCLNKVLPKSSSKSGASVKTSGKIQKRAVTKASREDIISKRLLVVTEKLKGSSNPSASAIDLVDLNVPSSSSTDYTISNPRELEEPPSLDTFLPKSSSKLDASVKTSGKRQKRSVLMRSSSEGETVAETLKVSSSSSAIGQVGSNVSSSSSTTLSTKVLKESPCLNKVLPKSSSKSGASVKTSGKIQKHAATKASREDIISKRLLVVTEQLKGSSKSSPSAIDKVDLNLPSSSSTDYTISNPRELEESPSLDTFLPKSSSKLDTSVKTSGKRQKRSVLMRSSSEGETVAETLKVSSSSSAIGQVDSNVSSSSSTTLSTKVLKESPCLNKVLPKSSSKSGASVKTSGKIQKRAVTKASRKGIISKLLLVVTEELKGSSNSSPSAIDQVDLNVPGSSSTNSTRVLKNTPGLDKIPPNSSSKFNVSTKTRDERAKGVGNKKKVKSKHEIVKKKLVVHSSTCCKHNKN